MTALPTYNESETVLSGVIVYGWRKYVFERSFRTTFSPSKPARKQVENGIPVQHLQYLPFGERFVDEHTSYQERFTFTGKETDCETGFSYFGARYYDPTLLTSWTAVDPMSDKYPNISPYAYCNWNPIRLIDPNGCETDEWNFNLQTGECVWVSDRGRSSGTDYINIVDADGGYHGTYVGYASYPCQIYGYSFK